MKIDVMDNRGIISVGTALIMPLMAFMIFSIIEFSFYFLGLFEANFIAMEAAKAVGQGQTIEEYFADDPAIFDAFCSNSSGSGYDASIETVTINGNDFDYVQLSCDWTFELSSAMIPVSGDLTPTFGYQTFVYDAASSSCTYHADPSHLECS